MKPIRFAVIGCGAISTIRHLPAMGRLGEAQLTVVVDTDHEWVQSVAGQFGGVRHSTDYRDVAGLVDAAVVATPNATHADIASFLLERGVHVLCEKPLATSVADAQRVILAAERGEARLMVAHTRRFTPVLRLLQRIIAAGWLGACWEVSASLGLLYSQWAARTDFRAQPRLAGGGVLMDAGVHLIDLALWLIPDTPCQVVCRTADPFGWGVEGEAEVEIRFQQGSRAMLACSFTHALNRTVTVKTEHGWAKASNSLEFYSSQMLVCRRDGAQTAIPTASSMYDLQLAHFCAALQSGQPFWVPLSEVLTGLELLEQCYASAEPLVAVVEDEEAMG